MSYESEDSNNASEKVEDEGEDEAKEEVENEEDQEDALVDSSSKSKTTKNSRRQCMKCGEQVEDKMYEERYYDYRYACYQCYKDIYKNDWDKYERHKRRYKDDNKTVSKKQYDNLALIFHIGRRQGLKMKMRVMMTTTMITGKRVSLIVIR